MLSLEWVPRCCLHLPPCFVISAGLTSLTPGAARGKLTASCRCPPGIGPGARCRAGDGEEPQVHRGDRGASSSSGPGSPGHGGRTHGPWTSQLRGRGNSKANVFKIIHSLIQGRSRGFIVGLEMKMESQCSHRKPLRHVFSKPSTDRAQL